MGRSTEKMELLGAEDVAEVMGVKETTVWRWCREGRLPCLKVGKHWRLRRETLEDFLEKSERSTTDAIRHPPFCDPLLPTGGTVHDATRRRSAHRHKRYSLKLVEEAFCELRLFYVLGSLP
jgi:excisionase family DNA binding protein